ncbi:hypothetical protein EX30DRAFT_364739 [Ascodesmis nigricans]|uniref:Uncharacterized protein n=1 Tax=Ascodesmis nigricans TaxID=341454 RepID=A0A4S2MUN4_9PEZI|nr:hypothetical protein EX30DRAFT_364739 [Ascodesmis nigricans]
MLCLEGLSELVMFEDVRSLGWTGPIWPSRGRGRAGTGGWPMGRGLRRKGYFDRKGDYQTNAIGSEFLNKAEREPRTWGERWRRVLSEKQIERERDGPPPPDAHVPFYQVLDYARSDRTKAANTIMIPGQHKGNNIQVYTKANPGNENQQ